jgi:hypothetical protein
MKRLLMIALFGLSLTACQKEGKQGVAGAQGAQGVAGPDAKTFTYNLTFNAGDTYKSYTGITGFDQGDMVVTYFNYENLGGEEFYVQTPYIYAAGNLNLFVEVGSETGILFVNALKADGASGSPIVGTITFRFKSILIKSTGLQKHPNLDLTSYKDVKEAFNL